MTINSPIQVKPGDSIFRQFQRGVKARDILIPAEMTSQKELRQAGSRKAGQMNKVESRYADWLEMQIAAGYLLAYVFEGMTLRLANNAKLTPDFTVILQGDYGTAFEFHEVKPRKKDGRFYAREDALLKMKFAAEAWPMCRFLIVWPNEANGWSVKEF